MLTLLALGVAFGLALVAGRFASTLRLPRVTAYLVVGLIIGQPLATVSHMLPGDLGWDPLFEVNQGLDLLISYTLGLILFGLGGMFQFAKLRRSTRKILAASSCEILATGALVFTATWLAGAPLAIAGVLACISLETGPATTTFVIREYDAEGPISETATLFTGLNGFMAVAGFIVLTHIIQPPGEMTVLAHSLGYALGVPIAIGVVAGFVLAVYDARIENPTERLLLGLASVGLVVGIASVMGVSPHLAALVAGVVLVNASPQEVKVFAAIKSIDYPLYVVLFVSAGARLHIEHIPHMGLIGLAYIGARTAGKLGGAFVGVRMTRIAGQGRAWLGGALLPHAGMALGLARSIAILWPVTGPGIEAIVLAAIVVFESLGPPLLRMALIRAGEVKLVTLLAKRAPVGPFEGIEQVISHFRDAVGIPSWHKLENPSDIPVSQLMRRNVETVEESATFDEVLRNLAATKYDRLLVVDGSARLAGVINYSDIRSVAIDPTLSKLVRAADLAEGEVTRLRTTDLVSDAISIMEQHPDMSFLPVVDPDDPGKLVGILSQNEVLSAFRKLS